MNLNTGQQGNFSRLPIWNRNTIILKKIKAVPHECVGTPPPSRHSHRLIEQVRVVGHAMDIYSEHFAHGWVNRRADSATMEDSGRGKEEGECGAGGEIEKRKEKTKWRTWKGRTGRRTFIRRWRRGRRRFF